MKEIRWRKLTRPRAWTPEEPGEQLVGYYLGQTVRTGKFGEYTVALFGVPSEDEFTTPMYVSGTTVISALDGGSVAPGAFVRVTFQGVKDLKGGRTVKLFDVHVAEGSICAEDARGYLAELEGS